MNHEIKTAWAAALRSGEYEQGTGQLRKEEVEGVSFCCLGVLCDLYVKAKGLEWKDNRVACEFPQSFFYGADAFTPDEVMLWADLGNSNPHINNGNLADLNDAPTHFTVIADLIEKHL